MFNTTFKLMQTLLLRNVFKHALICIRWVSHSFSQLPLPYRAHEWNSVRATVPPIWNTMEARPFCSRAVCSKLRPIVSLPLVDLAEMRAHNPSKSMSVMGLRFHLDHYVHGFSSSGFTHLHDRLHKCKQPSSQAARQPGN